ncbi:MAG TPA: twin-arginine translocation signal domain-containing protein, partial [Thermoanaerobaculia bacterium]
MPKSRRDFLKGCGAGAAAWAATQLLPGEFLISRLEAAEVPPDKLAELAAFALERAKTAGASYADI